ncbi:hypothetical protein [Streptomyces goshikiensis]|uniref:hypothetical protein n=1 Tax=Streptomyces goshikiensis TaxID=1942 RepID=UPI0022F3F3E3|nr:hypothetical protein [Streptomyces goshikiensis]WBY25092.1 hypothetical protein PET44_36295 [Streptomyces goshikiensis]
MAVEENVGLELPDIPEVQEGEPDAVYRLDAEDAARAGLSEDDIQIKTFWWKFEIHLSAQAADIAAEITELVGKVLAKVPKLKPFSPIIKAFCRLKAKWIRDVSAGKGCKLVSPWFAPGMLIPVQLKTPPDYYLYWCVYDPQHGWSAKEAFPYGQATTQNPRVEQYQDEIFCVYNNSDNKATLWSTRYQPEGDSWAPASPFPQEQKTRHAPALAVFQDRLYCVYRGANSTAMYSTYFENGGWSGPQQIHNNLTSEGVGLAVYDNRMYCAYRHSDGKSGQIYWMSSTDGTWPQAQPLHGHACDYEPSLITYNGELHLVYQGQDKKIWHVRYNGDWHSAQPLGTQRAIDGLSLAVIDNRLHCVYSGGTEYLFHTTWNGTGGWTPGKEIGHRSAQGPGIIRYRQKDATDDQLMCVFRGPN